jgi:hypothetical protein
MPKKALKERCLKQKGNAPPKERDNDIMKDTEMGTVPAE